MKRAVLTLVFVLSTAVFASAQTTFYFPQIADGAFGAQSFKTTILLTNPSGAATVSGSITFTKSDGTALNVAFVDNAGAATTGTIGFQLGPNKTQKFTSTGTAALQAGFATVSAPTGVITGTAYYSLFGPNGLIAEAGVPSASPIARQAVFVDSLGNFRTGVAYANPSTTAIADVTLQLMNTEGVLVVATTNPLNQRNHKSAFVSDLLTVPANFVGTMQINSTAPLVAVALRFAPAPSDLFTTISPVTLASLLSPYVNWLDKRQWLAPFTSLARLIGSFQFRLG